ncbi:MAG: hypothetical protein HYX60_07905 [Legionella longbeachae]|nr:hypothetical protein [Legionella longbeachae]
MQIKNEKVIINYMNQLLQEVTKNQNAELKVAAENEEKRTVDVEIHLGIKGPCTRWLIEKKYMLTMLHGLIVLQYKKKRDNLDWFKLEQRYPGLKVETIKDSQKGKSYFIKVNALPVNFFYNEEKYSLYDCLQRYQSYQKEQNIACIDPRIAKEQGKLPSPDICVQDLKEIGLITESTQWQPKMVGAQDGIILKRSNHQNIFVKKIDLDSLLDFAVLKIIKSCGVTAPSIELVLTKENCYQFSEDLSRDTPEKKYQYKSMRLYSNSSADFIYKVIIPAG